MKFIPIDQQKASFILRYEKPGGIDYAKAKENGETLLGTGAKLIFTHVLGWALQGYAKDGKDLIPYL